MPEALTAEPRPSPVAAFPLPGSHAACLDEAAPTPGCAPAAERLQIIDGLLRPQARISPKYFYDQRGSALFEAITRLPEYYPTRTERAIFERHGQDIARVVGSRRVVIEPGAGSCEKARALCQLLDATHFVGIDISADYLHGAVEDLRRAVPGLDARAVGGDLTAGMKLPGDLPAERRLVFYPGSSIGNFDPPAAQQLLAAMHALAAGAGGAILLGIDLPKDVAVLQAAYDDASGTTAAFNRNALVHLNRLIGSDFDPGQWRHVAFFDEGASRIEMHLAACRPQRVRWPGGGRDFAAGERIHTENSYKYPLPVFMAMLGRAGFRQPRAWLDERGWCALVHALA
ncbi:L-histidine N(alpha)-methyltransferase [Melaminivora sp.]|uniref:L-histidine N(alpha)-methyltransferase n=1 Tax=Melaminivora sp. TaxID=1933032 RepID=UPI0028AC7A83|nr:L-histidine N(alpha)-methyltransferase [Melaminivora sp.]